MSNRVTSRRRSVKLLPPFVHRRWEIRSIAACSLLGVCAALAGCSMPTLHSVSKGQWKSGATFSSRSTGFTPHPVDEKSMLRGRIDSTGKVELIASNGCLLVGSIDPKFDRWYGTVDATGCHEVSLNGRYDIVVVQHNSLLRLSARSVLLNHTSTVTSNLFAEMQIDDGTNHASM